MHKASIPHDALVFVGDGTRALFLRNRGTIQKPDLAVEIADALYRLAHAHCNQRLIVVVPPEVLGTLRKSFHKEVRPRVEAEVPKEVASYSLNEIRYELSGWW